MHTDGHHPAAHYASGRPASYPARDVDRELVLRTVISAMPLMGLVLGVVGMALWNAG
jgi:hypothetical protein